MFIIAALLFGLGALLAIVAALSGVPHATIIIVILAMLGATCMALGHLGLWPGRRVP